MKLLDIFARLPLSLQQKLAHAYVDSQLKKHAKVQIKGKENLESVASPCIFVANHLSNLDAVILMKLLKKRFDPHFVAGIKLSNDNFTNFFKSQFKTINIKPNTADLESMKTILNTLKNGESVMIFPEGTRSRDGAMSEAKKGITLIARMAKVPIVPIGLMGTEKVVPIHPSGRMDKERFQNGTVEVVIGQPFKLGLKLPGEDKHEYEERVLRDIMDRIAVNLKPQYRGIYGSKRLEPDNA